MKNDRSPSHSAPRRPMRGGFVLVAIMVLVMLLSMLAVSLLFRFKAEDTASSASVSTEQAWLAAMSGVTEAIRIASSPESAMVEWRNNPRAFKERLVFEDGGDRWYFTVFTPSASEEAGPLFFGLSDEASRVNANIASAESLSKIPGVTPAMGQALRDFVDFDDVPNPEGAEQDYYSELPVPYTVRNGPLNTVDELRLVRGFTPALVYGEDINLNGRLDLNEDDGDERMPADNKDGRLDLGLRNQFTVSSYEPNEARDGSPRVNLNDPKAALPAMELPPALTNFIAVMRKDGVRLGHPADLLEATHKSKSESGVETEVVSGVGKPELPLVLDLFTTTKDTKLDGLINVNTASSTVLAAVPGIDEPLAEAIVSTRRSIGPDRRWTTAWLFQEGLVDAARFKTIAPHLTARSFQFRFLVVGYGVPAGRFRVLEVGIDLKRASNHVSYLRDLTRFGMPFQLSGDAENVSENGSFHGAVRQGVRDGDRISMKWMKAVRKEVYRG